MSKIQLKPIVRTMLSALLVLVFAMAITPRIVLHDLVAHHKDSLTLLSDRHHAQIDKQGFQCNCDNLVAESLFIHYPDHLSFLTPRQFRPLEHDFLRSYNHSPYFRFGLRGPPALS